MLLSSATTLLAAAVEPDSYANSTHRPLLARLSQVENANVRFMSAAEGKPRHRDGRTVDLVLHVGLALLAGERRLSQRIVCRAVHDGEGGELVVRRGREHVHDAVAVERVRVAEIGEGENMEPLFRWCPYTMLFASEKSAAFAADRKMLPNDTQLVCP